MADDSGLKIFSIGIVTVAKARGDDYVKATPIEKLTMEKGVLSGESKSRQSALPNARGVKQTSTVKGGAEIVAKWIPYGESNRETPPDVQPGESILLFQYADTNEYYWTTFMREPTLRRLETVRYVFSNQPDGHAPYDENTSYWIEVSTHDKHVKFHTSTNDGEAAGYDITVDTKAGTFEVKDDVGNSLLLRSVEGVLTGEIVNKISLTSKEIELNATEKCTINTASLKMNAEKSTVTGSGHTIDAPVTMSQGMSTSGGSGAAVSITGAMEIDGTITGTADITTSGKVNASNI